MNIRQTFFITLASTCITATHTSEKLRIAVDRAIELGDDSIMHAALKEISDQHDPSLKQQTRDLVSKFYNSFVQKASQGHIGSIDEKYLGIFTPNVLQKVKDNLLRNGKSEETATTIITTLEAKIRTSELGQKMRVMRHWVEKLEKEYKDHKDLLPSKFTSTTEALSEEQTAELKAIWQEEQVKPFKERELSLMVEWERSNNQLTMLKAKLDSLEK
jgi:hypothetical protein